MRIATRPIQKLLGLTLAAMLLLTGMAPFTALASAGVPEAPDRALRAMTYNIHHAQGSDDVLNLQRIADAIRDSKVQVVELQEVDRHWSARSDFVDQAAWLARELGMHYVYGANLDLAPLEADQPRRQYGTAILSEYPILDSGNTLLPRPAGGEQRGLREALIIVHGVPVRVYNTHLQHNSQLERTAQVRAIIEHIGDQEEPTILMGDLNARPGDPELAPLYAQFSDAWLVAGEGPGHTISTTNPTARIDYVFVSRDIAVVDATVPDNERTRVASDHFPVIADLGIPGTRAGLGR